MHIMLVAGEASGDLLGAGLMAALRQVVPGPLRFSGVGGEQMSDAGLESLFPMEDLAVMGLAEVLPRLPLLLRRIRETTRHALATRPDAIVTIDAPSFVFRVNRKLAGSGIPRIHYVAPQVWAWRPGRARKLGANFDALLALLPFEPDFFKPYGIDCRFVGHPVVERIKPDPDAGRRFRERHGIAADGELLALLPGSRRGEISRLLPVFREACRQLAARHPAMPAVLPAVRHLADDLRAAVSDWPLPVTVVDTAEERQAALNAASVAMAASGTVTLELVLTGVPGVVAYKANPLTAAIVRRLLTVSHVALPNILAGREVLPEFIQENCRPELIAAGVEALLGDPQARARQLEADSEIARMLGANDEKSPSLRAAEAVLEVMQRSKAAQNGSRP